ncbi:hypothetical protein [Streptomyces cavernae]|uniref:hypothetical protein n=1 Tax=Streptomyces cavernae TaxID=2259034 RepID=UPI001EE40B4C|nr:hypothetical protein [Streptomyces cavernae]
MADDSIRGGQHLLPAFGPTETFDGDAGTPEVVVHVAYALTREQLLTALSIGFTEVDPARDAENLTVEEVRVEVEGWLSAHGIIELGRYQAQGQLTAYPPEAQPTMDALAEAIDRAYPARPPADRCPAAHPDDPTPCDGPPVVTVLDAQTAGADGCEHHGARLLASLEGGRVYPLPDAPEGAAIRVFQAAASIRPFPWLTDAPRTESSQRSHDENRRGGEDR